MPAPTIPLAEYASRRRRVGRALKNAVGVVFAGEIGSPLHDEFRPHPHFEYLTGITDEPGAVLVLDPGAAVETRREMLFLRPLNPEVEQWDGLRDPIGATLRARVGVTAVFRTNQLPRFLTEAARRSRTLACLHPLANYDRPVSPDLALFRTIAERVPNTAVVDQTEVMARLRAVKSSREHAMIAHAVSITAHGFAAAMERVEPGMNEFDLQETIEHAYRVNGLRGPAFGTIVGAGLNSTVLHYRANDQVIEKGDLICIDSGAAFGGYGADITRTIPASGRFTKRQREVYETVLRALKAATAVAKPGVRIAKLDQAARAVITKAGFGEYFIHSIGHHLGLETHDITPDEPLKAGAVVTIEPGIYIPDEKLGVRIEDDVVITKDGCRVLSAKIPKTVAAVEKAMKRR